jgi:cytochrome c nitrite reductase small subunit
MRTQRWLLTIIAVLAGIALGLGGFTFVYAKGYSYLSSDPAACANCHIMSDHFSAWMKSSHRGAASCNECHTPHALVPKYFVKARNGFWHSFYFTTGQFPDPLRITEPNHAVVEDACRTCHAPMTDALDHGRPPAEARAAQDALPSCTRCHRHVGHWLR